MKKSTLMTLTLFVIMGWAIGFVMPQQAAAVAFGPGDVANITELKINVTTKSVDGVAVGTGTSTPLPAKSFTAFVENMDAAWGVYFSENDEAPADNSTDVPLKVDAVKVDIYGNWKNTGTEINVGSLKEGTTYYIGLYYVDVKKDPVTGLVVSTTTKYVAASKLGTTIIKTIRWTVKDSVADTAVDPEQKAEWDFQTAGTSAEPPTNVTTPTADKFTATVAGEKVSVTVPGSSFTIADATRDKLTEYGVVYGTADGPTLETAGVDKTFKSTTVVSGTTGTFDATITNLDKSANPYYIRAYAKNSAGVEYGNSVPYKTPTGPDMTKVTTEYVVRPSSATFTITAGTDITDKGIFLDEATDPTTKVGSGATVTATGLTQGTKYNFKTYATDSFGTSYSTVQSFTTPVFGDFNKDKNATLADLVICVKVTSGQPAGTTVYKLASVNAGDQIDMVDAEYLLKKLSTAPAK